MSITSANAIITISQAILFPTAEQIQGFAADDLYDMESVNIIDELMGADGTLSFGFVFAPRPMTITLQADSASNDVFDAIATQQQAAEDVYPLDGTILLKGLSRQLILTNGALKNYKPFPDGKKTLTPRKYMITWNTAVPAPA